MQFHVYILANRTRVLYVGVTSNLRLRVTEHKDHFVPGFTQRYNVDRLVYFEEYSEAIAAIEREKRLKRMTRAKKIRLIEKRWIVRTDRSSPRLRSFHAVYRIERAPYGLRLMFTGTMSFGELERWGRDIAVALGELPKMFGVFVDMRGLVPLAPEAQGALRQGQLYARHLGMQRSVVIVDSAAVSEQFERIARETRIYAYERYVDALTEPNWEQMGIDWIVDAIDPDVGRRARESATS